MCERVQRSDGKEKKKLSPVVDPSHRCRTVNSGPIRCIMHAQSPLQGARAFSDTGGCCSSAHPLVPSSVFKTVVVLEQRDQESAFWF